MSASTQNPVKRRQLLKALGSAPLLATGGLAGSLAGCLAEQRAPAVIGSEQDRPQSPWGLQIGEPSSGRALIWSRADRNASLHLKWADNPAMRAAVAAGPVPTTADCDHTARLLLDGLPAGRDLFVQLEWRSAGGSAGEPLRAELHTAPAQSRNLRFVWGADTVGQGWGINPDDGGMRSYQAMLSRQPDFFIHAGDTIYADGPLQPQVLLPDGQLWRNAHLDAVPEKTRVAQTLHEFRRHFLYNLHDEALRSFNAAVPQFWIWDDHEVVNNWSPGLDLGADARYQEKNVGVLAARARRAFLEYAPMPGPPSDPGARLYRQRRYGPDIELFLLDMRSHRAANGPNRQAKSGPETSFLGRQQLDWLKQGLTASSAIWKIIVADMPLGLVVSDRPDAQGQPRFENAANGDGPPLGRELEFAELLGFLKQQRVRNTVWLTGDVHYCAAHRYHPAEARFADFDPFWEFVAGPLHAGSFGPSALDDSFGPSVVFQKTPPPGQANLPPSAGYQFFGQVDFDAASRGLSVSFVDNSGQTLFSQDIEVQ